MTSEDDILKRRAETMAKIREAQQKELASQKQLKGNLGSLPNVRKKRGITTKIKSVKQILTEPQGSPSFEIPSQYSGQGVGRREIPGRGAIAPYDPEFAERQYRKLRGPLYQRAGREIGNLGRKAYSGMKGRVKQAISRELAEAEYQRKVIGPQERQQRILEKIAFQKDVKSARRSFILSQVRKTGRVPQYVRLPGGGFARVSSGRGRGGIRGSIVQQTEGGYVVQQTTGRGRNKRTQLKFMPSGRGELLSSGIGNFDYGFAQDDYGGFENIFAGIGADVAPGRGDIGPIAALASITKPAGYGSRTAPASLFETSRNAVNDFAAITGFGGGENMAIANLAAMVGSPRPVLGEVVAGPDVISGLAEFIGGRKSYGYGEVERSPVNIGEELAAFAGFGRRREEPRAYPQPQYADPSQYAGEFVPQRVNGNGGRRAGGNRLFAKTDVEPAERIERSLGYRLAPGTIVNVMGESVLIKNVPVNAFTRFVNTKQGRKQVVVRPFQRKIAVIQRDRTRYIERPQVQEQERRLLGRSPDYRSLLF